MADLLLTNDDLNLTDGELTFITGQQAIGQSIEMRLKTWLGETVYDLSAGVPWLQIIFVKSTPETSIQFLLEDQVLGTPGVTGVTLNLDINRLTRVLTVTGTATTIEGDVDFAIVQTAEAA